MKRNSELVGLCQSSYWANGKWNKTMDWILNWFFSYCFVVVVVCCVMGSDSGMKVDWEEKIEIFLSKKCLWFHSAGWDLQNFPFFVVFVVVVVCWVCVNVHYGCGGAIEHKILPTNQIQTESTFLPLSLSFSFTLFVVVFHVAFFWRKCWQRNTCCDGEQTGICWLWIHLLWRRRPLELASHGNTHGNTTTTTNYGKAS